MKSYCHKHLRHLPFRSSLAVACFLFLLTAHPAANADIVLTITGEDSSTVVDWSLSGTVTVNQAMSGQSNDDMMYPTLAASGWDHLANVGTDGIVSTANIGSASISGAPTISVNGGSNLFSGIGLNSANFFNDGGGDSFHFLFTSLAAHPALNVGDTVTYGGSGSINLGVAKNTIFQDGTYVGEPLLHGSDTINLVVQSSAIPEPSSALAIAFLAVGSIAFVRRRRIESR